MGSHPEIITDLVQYDDKNKWMSLMDYCVLAEEHSKKYIANRKLYRRTFTRYYAADSFAGIGIQ